MTRFAGERVAVPPRRLSDQDYIRWLRDPDLTIGKDLRLEIADRLKQLSDHVEFWRNRL